MVSIGLPPGGVVGGRKVSEDVIMSTVGSRLALYRDNGETYLFFHLRPADL